MDQTTEAIVNFALMTSRADLPPGLVHSAKQKVVDAVACGLGGLNSPPARIARRVALNATSDRGAGLFGSPHRVSHDQAAFANGVAIRQLDYNDTYPGGHPSDLLGAVLGSAAATGADGQTVLRSLVIGYEIFGAFVDDAPMGERGWDSGLAVGPACAAALGHLFGLTAETMRHAVSLSVMDAPALRQSRAGELSMWKGCAGPNSARNGAIAAQLAAEGMTAPGQPFEGKHALFEAATGPFTLTFPARIEDAQRVQGTSLKYFPLDFNAQASVWAAKELRTKIDLADLSDLLVTTYQHAKNESAGTPQKWDPQTRETADHSLPYIMATTLREGFIDLRHFELDRVRDPALRPIMNKIRVEVDPTMTPRWPKESVLHFTATTIRDERFEVHIENPRGHSRNPMSDDEISGKLRTMAGGVLPSSETEALLGWLWQIDRASSVDELFRLLATAKVAD
ncbi:MAG: MmgE/PrpD family protein [Dehalococcoidia bacterium]|nr:MmgE/PrpD family protein [Dehalococcoidia bacterium]